MKCRGGEGEKRREKGREWDTRRKGGGKKKGKGLIPAEQGISIILSLSHAVRGCGGSRVGRHVDSGGGGGVDC